MRGDGMWFAPRRLGYGAGLPVAWQGWALIGGYVVIVLAATRLLPVYPTLFGVTVAMLTLILVAVCVAKTRGGWRWRDRG